MSDEEKILCPQQPQGEAVEEGYRDCGGNHFPAGNKERVGRCIIQ